MGGVDEAGMPRACAKAVAALTPARKQGMSLPSTGRGFWETPTAEIWVRSNSRPSSLQHLGQSRGMVEERITLPQAQLALLDR